jgi:predicted DNA-binding ribbon-helix-helix protein
MASNVHSQCVQKRVRQNATRYSWRMALQRNTSMKSPIVKRSIVIGGHKTSVSLEDAFWQGLKEIALGQRTTLSNTVAEIDRTRQQSNLSSAIRLFVLDHLRAQISNGAVRHAGADNRLAGAGSMNGGSYQTHV